MTTINEWREETDAIISELLEDGSNPESEYTIEPVRTLIAWRNWLSTCSRLVSK